MVSTLFFPDGWPRFDIWSSLTMRMISACRCRGRSKGDRVLFVFFVAKSCKEKTVGRCDVWGVQPSEIFNNSTFSSQDRSCCQSL